MKNLSKLVTAVFLTALLIFPAVSRSFTTQEKDSIIDVLRTQLPAKTSARDSLRVLYDIFDLASKNGQKEVVWQIYETAGRAQDLNAQLDMLRNMSVLYMSKDSVIDELMKMTRDIPNEDARNSTKLFIKSQWLNRKATYAEPAELEQMLLKLIRDTKPKEGDNVYDRMLHLLAITQYLGGATDGALFQESIEKYGEMIDNLPESDYYLKNQFNTTCAILYTKSGQPEKAVESDRKLLKVIQNLQKMYARKKRSFRNYDVSKFICYRRMLSNYEALSQDEVQALRDSIEILVGRSKDVKGEMEKHGQPEAYYLMALGQYDKAIPAIQKTLSTKIPEYQKIKLYRMLRDAAKKTGNRKVLLEALEGYDAYLEDSDSLRKASLEKERMLRAQLKESDADVDLRQIEKLKHDLQASKNAKTALYAVSSVLGILLIVYMIMFVRLRRRSRRF